MELTTIKTQYPRLEFAISSEGEVFVFWSDLVGCQVGKLGPEDLAKVRQVMVMGEEG